MEPIGSSRLAAEPPRPAAESPRPAAEPPLRAADPSRPAEEPPQSECVVLKVEPLDLCYERDADMMGIKEENNHQPEAGPLPMNEIIIKIEPVMEYKVETVQVEVSPEMVSNSKCDNDQPYNNKQKNTVKRTNKKLSNKRSSKNKTQSDPGVYPCARCEHVFTSAGSLYRHSRVHSTSEHVCNVCQQSFKRKTLLIKHKAHKCSYENSLTCNFCQKRFLLPSGLESHLKRHTNETPFQCDVCTMKFKWKSTLVRHMKLHSNDKPFSCKFCDKKFTNAGLIKAHLRVHTGEKPYQCPICLRKFSHKHSMDQHQLTHNKVKQLICQICYKEFPKESRLKYHMRVHWDDKKPFKCQICPKMVSTRQSIVSHYSRKHPNDKYDSSMTDASIATTKWLQAVSNAAIEQTDCILPDT